MVSPNGAGRRRDLDTELEDLPALRKLLSQPAPPRFLSTPLAQEGAPRGRPRTDIPYLDPRTGHEITFGEGFEGDIGPDLIPLTEENRELLRQGQPKGPGVLAQVGNVAGAIGKSLLEDLYLPFQSISARAETRKRAREELDRRSEELVRDPLGPLFFGVPPAAQVLPSVQALRVGYRVAVTEARLTTARALVSARATAGLGLRVAGAPRVGGAAPRPRQVWRDPKLNAITEGLFEPPPRPVSPLPPARELRLAVEESILDRFARAKHNTSMARKALAQAGEELPIEYDADLWTALLAGAPQSGQVLARGTLRSVRRAIGRDVAPEMVDTYLALRHYVDVLRLHPQRVLPAGMKSAGELNDALARMAEELGPGRWEQVETAAGAVRGMYADLLSRKAAEGLIPTGLATELKNNYPWYNPINYMERDMVAHATGGGRVLSVASNDLRYLSEIGRDLPRASPLGLVARYAVQGETLIARNQAARAVVKSAELNPEMEGLVRRVSAVRPVAQTEEGPLFRATKRELPGTISYMEHGERITYEVPQKLERMAKALSMAPTEGLEVWARNLNNIPRTMLTSARPDFFAANFLLDTFTVAVLRGVMPWRVGRTLLGNLAALAREDPNVARFYRARAGIGGFSGRTGEEILAEAHNIDTALWRRILGPGRKLLEGVEQVGQAVETAPRRAVFERELERGAAALRRVQARGPLKDVGVAALADRPRSELSHMTDAALSDELKRLPLTHVSGLGAGQQEFRGTYLSTEVANRYLPVGGKLYSATANLKRPRIFRSSVEYAAYRERFLPPGIGIDDATEAQRNAAAHAATEDLKKQGFDGVYLPSAQNNEGIVVVFDRDAVQLSGERIITSELLSKETARAEAAYESAAQGGLSSAQMGQIEARAALAARRATVDFAQGGSLTRQLNNIFLYLNAGVGGAMLPFRALLSQDPRLRSVAMLGLASYEAITFATWLYNRQFPEYHDISFFNRVGKFVIMHPVQDAVDQLGNKQPKYFTMPPILREFSLFSGPLLYILNRLDDRPETGFREFATQLAKINNPAGQVMGGGFTFFGEAFMEIRANHDRFFDRPIVPPELEGLPPGEQYDQYTSETAKRVGRAIGYSPKKLDHLIRNGVGWDMVSAADRALLLGAEDEDPEIASLVEQLRMLPDLVPPDAVERERRRFLNGLSKEQHKAVLEAERQPEPTLPFVDSLARRFYRARGGALYSTALEAAARKYGISVKQTRAVGQVFRETAERMQQDQLELDELVVAGVDFRGNPYTPEQWRKGRADNAGVWRTGLLPLKLVFPGAAQFKLPHEDYEGFLTMVNTYGGLIPDRRDRGALLYGAWSAITPEEIAPGEFDLEAFFVQRDRFLEERSEEDRSLLVEERESRMTFVERQWEADLALMRPYWDAREREEARNPQGARMAKALKRAVAERDTRGIALYSDSAALKRLNRDIRNDRERLRERDPALDATLRFWGYVTTSKTGAAERLWQGKRLGREEPH